MTMRIKALALTSTILLLLSFSCKRTQVPADIEAVLSKAGSNRSELEEVIEHYSADKQDSLKLQATYYLITGMKDRYYYQGELLDNYLDYLELINRDTENGEYVENCFKRLYGPFSLENVAVYKDLETVKAEELINNIEMAFKVWKEQPWGKNISFSNFCEYLLPYRIEDEVPEYHREKIYTQYRPMLDSLIAAKGTAVQACKLINDKLIKDKWLFTVRMGYLPHFPAAKGVKHQTGKCRDMCDMGLYVMRASGIPVAIDFIPQWPERAGAHSWNVVLNDKGKTVHFLAAEDSPGTIHKPGTKKAKIYRNTYTINPNSLGSIKRKDENIPGFLYNRRIKDVTDEYVKCFDVEIPLSGINTSERFAYISVFDNQNWQPVHWSKIRNSRAVFTKMEVNGLYVAGTYTDQAQIEPANFAFIVDSAGKAEYLKPDTIRKIPLLITERSPFLPDWFLIAMKGGKFQGANKADFSDAVDLYTIPGNAEPYLNTVKVSNSQQFRYVRYYSAPATFCNIGPVYYISPAGEKLKGKVISKDGDYKNYNFRHNKETLKYTPAYYKSKFSNSGWIGYDFGKPYPISKIVFAPSMGPQRNPTLIEGHNYKLFYWNYNQWTPVAIQKAANGELKFSAPANALYRILDQDENEEVKRIFTYKQGKQIWW